MSTATQKCAPTAGTAKVPHRSTTRRILRILVVHREPDVRALLMRIFREHQVAQSINTEDAKNLLESYAFDVVISDDALSGASGIELLAHVEVFHPDVHRILFCASRPQDLAALVQQGVVQDFVAKTALRELVELCASKLRKQPRLRRA